MVSGRGKARVKGQGYKKSSCLTVRLTVSGRGKARVKVQGLKTVLVFDSKGHS